MTGKSLDPEPHNTARKFQDILYKAKYMQSTISLVTFNIYIYICISIQTHMHTKLGTLYTTKYYP